MSISSASSIQLCTALNGESAFSKSGAHSHTIPKSTEELDLGEIHFLIYFQFLRLTISSFLLLRSLLRHFKLEPFHFGGHQFP